MPEESRTAIKAALALSSTARTASQIREELTGSFDISPRETTALLNRMATEGEIFLWPGKRYWDRRPREEAVRLIVKFLAGSSVETSAKIRSALKLPMEVVAPALDQLVAEGRVHIWQPGKTAMYCLVEPQAAAQESILKSLAAETLSERELIGRIRSRLPGYTAALLRKHLQPLLRSGQVLEHPRYGKTKAKYGSSPPEPDKYLDKAVKEMETVHRILAASGVSLGMVLEALGRRLGLSGKNAAFSPKRGEGKTASAEIENLILQQRSTKARDSREKTRK